MSEQAHATKLSEEETTPIEGRREISPTELRGIAEALIFVADEPLSARTIAEVLEIDQDAVEAAIIGRRDIKTALDDAAAFWNSKLAP